MKRLTLLFILFAAPASAQSLDWPSVIAAAAGQLGDATTTAYFLTGHGQSVDHVGPCVEVNAHFQPSDHQLAKVWATKIALVGGLVIFNYVIEHWKRDDRTLKVTSQGLNYFAAAIGAQATVHNVRQCGI